MFHVVLYQPEIAPNTGNVMRLCANTGLSLHLIRPLGFELDDARLRRAGLDYTEWSRVRVHERLADFLRDTPCARVVSLSTRGDRSHTQWRYRPGDALLFGPETRGLPPELRREPGCSACLRIPMRAGSRSLNLSNAVAVVCYEAWRQTGFRGAAPPERATP